MFAEKVLKHSLVVSKIIPSIYAMSFSIIHYICLMVWYDATTAIATNLSKPIKLCKYEAVYIDNLRMHVPYSIYV